MSYQRITLVCNVKVLQSTKKYTHRLSLTDDIHKRIIFFRRPKAEYVVAVTASVAARPLLLGRRHKDQILFWYLGDIPESSCSLEGTPLRKVITRAEIAE